MSVALNCPLIKLINHLYVHLTKLTLPLLIHLTVHLTVVIRILKKVLDNGKEICKTIYR